MLRSAPLVIGLVQIDDRKSSYQSSQYGVPQGSILGPMIFNLYVSDLHEVTPPSMECVQYADDTSLYSHSNVKELDSRAVDMNETLASITNLIPKKTQVEALLL